MVEVSGVEPESEMSVLDLEEELADQQSFLVLEWPEKIPQWIERHHAHITHIQICL
jgi:tRNA A37 threonylcarbamoyladenosine biosynthesis protein TsaE